MTTNTLPPKGYFNATEMLAGIEHPKGVKVSQFLDNKEIQYVMSNLDTPVISASGRYGYTFLPWKLHLAYKLWLLSIINKQSRLYYQPSI